MDGRGHCPPPHGWRLQPSEIDYRRGRRARSGAEESLETRKGDITAEVSAITVIKSNYGIPIISKKYT